MLDYNLYMELFAGALTWLGIGLPGLKVVSSMIRFVFYF